MDDPHDLERFVQAQDPVIVQVLNELRAGRKRSHWMWFVFPQLKGLGHSAMAQRYGISSPEEAKAYFEHPILGPRLVECTGLANRIEDKSANQIFGDPDDMKFRSAMTLFAHTAPDPEIFQTALRKYFNGKPDPLTIQELG